MLRFSFVPLVAVLLGLLCGLWTLTRNSAIENPPSAALAQKQTCPQVKPLTIRATRKDKMEAAVEENIRKWSVKVRNSTGEERLLAYYFRAENYYVIGKYDDAINDLDSAVGLAKEVRTYFNASIHNGRGQHEAALNELGRDKYGREARAYALLKTGQADQCVKECNKCIEQHNDNELTYLLRGQAYQALGKNQKAIRDFTRSLYKATDCDESFADYLSGQSYDVKTELRLLHNAEVYHRRAVSLARTGKSAQAMQDVKQSVRFGFSPGLDACLSQGRMGCVSTTWAG